MTSATERIRALLDERGVEYDTDDEDGCEFTEWVANGLEWEADSRGELVSLMPVMLITPEQAIAATLGSCNCTNDCTNSERTDTCYPIISDNLNESEGMGDAWADCSECGHLLFVLTDPNSKPPNFCPNCGRKVVDDG